MVLLVEVTVVVFFAEDVFVLVAFAVAGVLVVFVGPPKTNHTSVVKTKSLNDAI